MSETPNKLPKSARNTLILLALILLAAALWALFGKELPPLTQHAPPQDSPSSVLQDRLDEANAKIKALETTNAAPKPPSDEDAKIAALQAKVEALSKQQTAAGAPDAHLEAQISSVNARLDAVIALFEIKDAAGAGQPFAAALAALKQAMSGDAAAQTQIAQLAPYTDKGAPTLAELRDSFEAEIPAALSAGDKGGILHILRGFISIRRIGETSGSGDDAVIARAEARLKGGDIEKTASGLSALSPAAAKSFAPWEEQAKAAIAVRHAIAALEQALLKGAK